jgi:multidrug efflux pump subunit AcrB
LEDPEFTIKEALITTPYPGASAEEVEEEVSDVIEQAVQEMGQLKRVESTSKRGVSVVKAYILDKYSRPEFPQIWDELRKKVGDYQAQLPPGAGPSQVNDDFGDVYGVYLALTGDGYSMAELHEYAKLLQKELTLATDVKRVELYGVQSEAIYVEMSRPKMAALGISQQDIHAALTAKNIPADAGRLLIRPEYIPINPSGEFMSEQEFGELLVSAPGADTLVYLKDVATVRRGYVDPPQNIMRFNGEPAIALGISTVSGGNVVVMGDAINEKLRRLQAQTPLGMELHKISMQSEAVTTAIDGFMVTLGQAVAIVVVVLLLFMGLRSGLIIGTILFLTISGTFLFMGTMGVTLERISLGALIIALGMLVDNAIVVVDGMRVRIEAGQDATEAASDVVGQTAIPLLGATVVAILAFAAIGTSKDATGEFCRSLFTVILISLSLSWVVAVTTTPLLAKIALKVPKKKTDEAPKDPYAGALFQGYKRLLTSAIQFRWVTVGAVLAIFVASLVGFGSVDQMFFPNSTKPQFFIEFYFPEGTHIRETEARLAKVEEYLRSREGVTDVATAVGGGDLRFILTYVPIAGSSANGAIFVGVTDYRLIDGMTAEVREQVEELVPGAVIAVKKFLLGPGEGGKIQLRISGQDRAELRRLASTAKQILREGGGVAVRDEWKNSVKVVRPYLAEDRARQLGITRPNLAQALQASYDGYRTGVYREADELLPILARAPEYERQEASSLQDLQIWSPAAGRMIPMRQVLTDIRTESEDSVIWRRNRTTTVKIHADPDGELPSVLFARVKGPIEEALGVDAEAYLGRPVTEHTSSTLPIVDSDQVPLAGRPGYFIAWGGEAEDSARAGGALAVSIPIFIGMMILTVIALFNAIKQTLIIWLTVPLAIIGVTVGLLAFGQPFGFMALLGLLSLVGMLIKNAIVLIDEIDTQSGTGKDRFQSVIDSGLSRLMPVSMAAATTILGMIPLLQDAFFVSMAVTIMVGLLFATILTLVIVPVLYAIFFRIPYGTGSEVPA